MANNPNSIRLGACRVRWGGRDLGMTKGGVDVTIKAQNKPIEVDQFGKTIVQEYVMGRSIMVKVPFAETDLDSLYSLLKTSGGTLTDNGVRASGTLTFSANPAAADTIVVAGHTFTFVTAVTGADQILIGATPAATIVNAVRVLNASSDSNVTQLQFTGSATTITISPYKSGVAGNNFVISRTGTAVTTSGATLTGGVDATSRLAVVQSGAGIGLYGTALPLVLHPIDRADNDFTEDFVVPLANNGGSLTFAYKVDVERIFVLEFTGYVNVSNKTLFTYGDDGVH